MANLIRQILLNDLGDLYSENKALQSKYKSKRYLFPKKHFHSFKKPKKYYELLDSLSLSSIDEIKQEILNYSSENEKLFKSLSRKSFKAVDFVIDSVYSVARHREKPEPIFHKISLINKIKNSKSKTVDIINHNFYDWDGKTVFKGGAERYVFDLCLLLKANGYHPRIIQGANSSFKKTYRGIEVIGIVGKKGDFRDLSKRFNDYCKDSAFVIASPLELACEITSVPCVGINHGINFDGLETEFDKPQFGYYALYKDALRNVAVCVCVDTNFINWFRTKDYRLSNKLVYVPNYFDESVFNQSLLSSKKTSKRVRFVYPRRIYTPRGYDLTIAAFRRLLSEGFDVDIAFIGQYDNEKCRNNVESFISEYPDNVSHAEYPMEKAQLAYKDADVVLVPTRHSEGTSLSCIEAQALGIPVISTNVGGLPNIIIDHYNGLLISPTSDALHDAAVELLTNKDLRDSMGKNALKVATSSFRKTNWDSSWLNVIVSLKELMDQ